MFLRRAPVFLRLGIYAAGLAALEAAAAAAVEVPQINVPLVCAAAAGIAVALGLAFGARWAYVLGAFGWAPAVALGHVHYAGVLFPGEWGWAADAVAVAFVVLTALVILPLIAHAEYFFRSETDRAYLRKFALIYVVAGLFGLTLARKDLDYGQDLAGGAELRYAVTRRVAERLFQLSRYMEELDDPQKAGERRRRLEDVERRLKDSGVGRDERERLTRVTSDVEFELSRERLARALDEVRGQMEAVAEGAEIVRRRIDPNTLGDIEVRTVGASRLLIRIPHRRRAGESDAEAVARLEARVQEIQRVVEQQGVLKFYLGVRREENRAEYEDAERYAGEGRPQNPKRLYALPRPQYDEVAERFRKGLDGESIRRSLADKSDEAVAREMARRVEDEMLRAGYIPWAEPGEGSGGKAREGYPILLERHGEGGREGVFDGSVIDRAYHRMGDEGWEISMDFTVAGRKDVARITEMHSREESRRQLAIVLDDVCHSAPVLKSALYDSGRITGSFTETEAKDLATVLTAGSLPVQIEFEGKSVVGPSLGRDSIRMGMWACVTGGAGVLAFMGVYYLAGGLVSVLCMALNMVLLLGGLAAFNAKLTLPGIAGIVLTIGMAVDANVLIFERIREELARGRTLKLAVQAGFDRAFITIMDSNVTTLITAAVLYWFGTGPVRGFAVTLSLGILASLFTALYVSRAIIEFAVTKEWLKNLRMLRLVGTARFPFMGLRPAAYALSILLVAGGVYAYSTYPDKYGIDFTGGSTLTVQLRDEMPDDEMRAISESALSEMQAKELDRAREHGDAPLDFGRVRVQSYNAQKADRSRTFSLALRMDVDQLREYRDVLKGRLGDRLSPESPFPSQESIGQAVSAELGASAARALIFALVLIFLYIILRFEFNPSFGVGAVLALAHDVCITAGAMALVDRLGILPAKIDLQAVAALLTIVGYSLNDTIVVFDRIREVRAEGKSRPMKEIIDEAVGATLSRTIITSLTTLVASVSLLVLGGDATRGFAFAMTVGVGVGTYSSIFVAAPLIVEWENLRSRAVLRRVVAYGAAAGALAVVALFIWQAHVSAVETERRDLARTRLERVRTHLNLYAARHAGEYPPDLTHLLAASIGEEARDILEGAGEPGRVGYAYVSGLRSDDSPGTVLAFTPEGHLAYGGYVLDARGTLEWVEARTLLSRVRATTSAFRGADRKIKIIPSGASVAAPNSR